MKIGHRFLREGKCRFVVWAPFRENVSVKVLSQGGRTLPMTRDERGYWRTESECSPDDTYMFQLEDIERADPASHSQPWGVHGPSCIVDHDSFKWTDADWEGVPLREMVMYEIHVGTFTEGGTFDGLIPRLFELSDLGVNAIELMPVAQFPGDRNWGYDGVYPFAVQSSYGGPDGFKRLVNECHRQGISVILDVVYNHLGPEGNYLSDFGPYFTDKYRTPWGMAINFDDAYSNEVRNFFIENSLHWFENYHVDALRLDAVHGIADLSAKTFLRQLAEKVDEYSGKRRRVYLIAESDLNDTKFIRTEEKGGYGLDAQWCDDFHHSLHSLLTCERKGYYQDFGQKEDLVKAMKEGFVYCGQYSKYRKRNHGVDSVDIPAHQFVVFSQNHDQVGNRFLGERLASLVSFESLKTAAALVLFSPYIPLLFMGEEYGEENPFLYFVDHPDAALAAAVKEGRLKEFEAFADEGEPPDPGHIDTFVRSRLAWEKRLEGHGKVLLDFYRHLLKLRKNTPALSYTGKDCLSADILDPEDVFVLHRWVADQHIVCWFNFNPDERALKVSLESGVWRKLIDSADIEWGGGGTLIPEAIINGDTITLKGRSVAVYERDTQI